MEKDREVYENPRLDHYDAKGTCPGVIHVVKKGDTLYEISRMHHVSVQRIMFANPYVNVYNLQIGDELCIPTAEEK